jgi:phage-related tail protein
MQPEDWGGRGGLVVDNAQARVDGLDRAKPGTVTVALTDEAVSALPSILARGADLQFRLAAINAATGAHFTNMDDA